MKPVLVRAGVVALFGLAAVAFVTSLPLGWGAADAPDGTRYKVSPLGVSHVLQLHQTVSPTVDCRWVDAATDPLCALRPDAALAARGIGLVRLLMLAAAVLAGIGAATWSGARRTPDGLRRLAAAAPAVAALGAVLLFAVAVPAASVVLHDLSFGVGGTKGTLQVAVATALLLGLAAGPGLARAARPSARLTSGGLVALGALAFVLQFPPASGLVFALAALAAGAKLGLAAQARPLGAPARPG